MGGPKLFGGLLVVLALLFMTSPPTWAANPAPQQGTIGLEATISSAPPTRAATIAVPVSGAVFTSVPINISGLCQTGLLVKIFDNGVFVGSTVCANGSYSVQIALFSSRNDLVARVFDALDQAGPDSGTVTVTFNDAQFLRFGSHVSLTSAYAIRGAAPNSELDWPLIISDGEGPYAVSVDWGDGSPADLFSLANSGPFTVKHTYKSAGIYRLIVKATDKNGGTAFLQLVGQATGAIQATKSTSNTTVIEHTAWWPALAMLPLVAAAYWTGGKKEAKHSAPAP
jgi:hypothetical protein